MTALARAGLDVTVPGSRGNRESKGTVSKFDSFSLVGRGGYDVL
jgi:hypothetical protein